MKALLLIFVVTGLPGAAYAQPGDALAQAVIATPTRAEAAGSALDLSSPRAPSRFASPLPAGIAKTSIDRRFADDDAVGSFGYLCGLNPGQKMTGAAGAAGYDPMGKFLGAKLSFAFR
jgi:hypothetical protein